MTGDGSRNDGDDILEAVMTVWQWRRALWDGEGEED